MTQDYVDAQRGAPTPQMTPSDEVVAKVPERRRRNVGGPGGCWTM